MADVLKGGVNFDDLLFVSFFFLQPSSKFKVKVGTYYPCSRAVLTGRVVNTAREHGCHFGNPSCK